MAGGMVKASSSGEAATRRRPSSNAADPYPSLMALLTHLSPAKRQLMHTSPMLSFPARSKRDRETSTAEDSQNLHRCRRIGSPGRDFASPEDDNFGAANARAG